MIIPGKMKDETINKLKSLLKHYLVNIFEEYGYDVGDTEHNKDVSNEAKQILKLINAVEKGIDIQKEALEQTFTLYNKVHVKNGGMWKV